MSLIKFKNRCLKTVNNIWQIDSVIELDLDIAEQYILIEILMAITSAIDDRIKYDIELDGIVFEIFEGLSDIISLGVSILPISRLIKYTIKFWMQRAEDLELYETCYNLNYLLNKMR